MNAVDDIGGLDEAARALLAARAERFARPVAEDRDEATLDVLLFRLGDQHLALGIDVVAELLPPAPFTSLPDAGAMAGLRNVRGVTLPLVDIGPMLGTARRALNESFVIVVGPPDDLVGVLVDAVDGLLSLTDADVRRPPTELASEISPVVGVAPDAVLLLDGARILRHPELTSATAHPTEGATE